MVQYSAVPLIVLNKTSFFQLFKQKDHLKPLEKNQYTNLYNAALRFSFRVKNLVTLLYSRNYFARWHAWECMFMLPVLNVCTPYRLPVAQGQDLRNTAIIQAKTPPRMYKEIFHLLLLYFIYFRHPKR